MYRINLVKDDGKSMTNPCIWFYLLVETQFLSCLAQ